MPTISVRTAAGVAILAALALMSWFATGCGGDEERADNEQSVAATIDAVVAEVSATRDAESTGASPTADATVSPTLPATPIFVPTLGLSAGTNSEPASSAPAGPEPLAPLPISDPQSLLAGVSEAERACLSENVPAERLADLMDSPESHTAEERQAVIGCLEEDTALRLFLTPVLSAAGTLSAESSECLRTGFAGTNVGALMSAAAGEPGANADPEAAAATAMVSFMVSLSCLNEDEFQMAGPALGVSPEDYDNFQCVLEHVGGPERMAQMLDSGPGFPAPLFDAAFACQVQVSGAPPG